jgi:hypothetical protein
MILCIIARNATVRDGPRGHVRKGYLMCEFYSYLALRWTVGQVMTMQESGVSKVVSVRLGG